MHRVRLEVYFTSVCSDHREKERRPSGLETKLPACCMFAKQLKLGHPVSPIVTDQSVRNQVPEGVQKII
jgi:hypothetical protein